MARSRYKTDLAGKLLDIVKSEISNIHIEEIDHG